MIDLYQELEKYTDDSCLKLVLQEHPEIQTLWDRRETLAKPMVVNGVDPILHVLFEAMIEKQIQASDPPEMRRALERMLQIGLPRSVARGAIVKVFRWYFDRGGETDTDYLQKLNFLGHDPGKTERNQACPCLSGKKFKKCCLSLKELLEIDPEEGALHLGATSYFKPHFNDPESAYIYTEMENRSHFYRFLERAGDNEGALLYLQENVKASENDPNPKLLVNALKELLFFCTQHPEFAGIGLEAAERLIALPEMDSYDMNQCRCDRADLLAIVHGVESGIQAYQNIRQELPEFHYASYRYADLLNRSGQTENAVNILEQIKNKGDLVDQLTQAATAELLKTIQASPVQ